MSRRRPAQTAAHHDQEGDIQPCARGCTRCGQHQPYCPDRDGDLPDDHPDRCDGCLPTEAEVGLLCRQCHRHLTRLLADLNDPESVAAVCAWLADNLGQHVRSKAGGNTSRSATPGEGFVTVMAALSDLQISWAEMAGEFIAARGMRPLADTDPSHIAARLRPWVDTLASWEPIADQLDHLIELRGQAHGVCPWRGKHPDAVEEVAAVLYLAPAETGDEIAARFSVSPSWVRVNHSRGRIQPIDPKARKLEYRPWDVYALLHPDAAKRYEAALATLGQEDVIYSTRKTCSTRPGELHWCDSMCYCYI